MKQEAKPFKDKLESAKQKTWVDTGTRIVKRYKDERPDSSSKATRYNILWSNIRTIQPAVYARKPQAEVNRRDKDAGQVARVASEILERALQFEIDYKNDYDSAIRNALLDRLLCGRGVAWVRYEPQFEPQEQAIGENQEGQSENEGAIEPQITEDVEPPRLICAETPVDYVYWQDFRHSPARTWEEVEWVARRVYMGKEQLEERFGEEAQNIQLTMQPEGLDDKKSQDTDNEHLKKAVIWEFWDKTTGKVTWISDGSSNVLDEKDDPLGLDCFFPCPKPLFSTLTTDSLTPVPDYIQYEDQAKELDQLTKRISYLVKAVKVVGVYDASADGVKRLMNEGVDNQLIPVNNWAMFAEKGGVQGAMQFMPLDMVVSALDKLYAAREATKQVIYDVIGMSDIIRGSSVASETATAQKIKGQYASLRLKELQTDIARFASDLLNIKAQIICSLYPPQTLIEISGIASSEADQQYIEPAIQLLQNDTLRAYAISVASDSLVDIDEDAEKQSRLEFLNTVGGFIEKSLNVPPQLIPLVGELLLFGVRSFRSGRALEGSIEQAVKQMTMQAQQPKAPPQPDPMVQIKQQEVANADKKIQIDANLKKYEIDVRAKTDKEIALINRQTHEVDSALIGGEYVG